ncbi:STAS domain-containing protein [Krasilnikovia sp. M28-CT-15]|uniref:STAS domain-containing protein n=1 Tax=Krasilnikovia sp. M28-CT-15 TaxID=3373540 RepID=UPI003876DB81
MVEIRVVGDLDRDAAPMLIEVADYVSGLAVRQVVVELGRLGFAGSALSNWLASMQNQLPRRSSLAVRHPQPFVGRVLAVTDLAHLVDDGRSN